MRARLVLGLALGHVLGSQSSRALQPGSRGIAVSLSLQYDLQARAFAEQVARIRYLGCRLPIEVWEAGDEMTNTSRPIIEQIPGVTFRNLDGLVPDPSAWRGWQIKGAIPRFTAYDELLLVDGDIGFASNPEALFETAEYRATGTYFFRDDQSAWRFFSDAGASKACKSCQSRSFYDGRREWLQKLFGPTMPAALPPEWAYHWREGYEVNATKEVMDSGVVALDRRRHPGLVRHVFRLNEDKAETYRHVWGDKETFWLAALLAGEPFAFHPREARHECLSLLAYATIGRSWSWRRRVRLWDNGEALSGTAFYGLMQRSVSGRMIYYHRKIIDVPMPQSWVLDANGALCAARVSIDERNQDWFPHGIPLTHWVVKATLLWLEIAIGLGVLLALCVAGLCARRLARSRLTAADEAQSRRERKGAASDERDDAPLLSRGSSDPRAAAR